ncbi:nucleotidyltransferase domain-containing protein [Falsibacillus pallidus]|uniref:nucleotidyltransferase domain-containing protein n=1 Tax=Falsibacillus pallidus TaxID=493781 RepID=UPI003D982E42
MAQCSMDEREESQLLVLTEVSGIAESLGMELWLRGGWAIDFLLGRVTRPHEDIDFVAWVQDRQRLEAELASAGYEKVPVNEPFCNRQSDFRKNEVDCSLVFITHSVEGEIIMNGLPEWVWRPDSLMTESYTLNGISARVLNPKQLLEEKEVYEQIGRPHRQKDAESKKILKQMILDRE